MLNFRIDLRKAAMIAVCLAVTTMFSCKKNDKIKEDDAPVSMEEIMQTDAIIAATADSILLSEKPIEGFRAFAEKYRKLPGVAGVDVQDDAMFVRYPDGLTHVWLNTIVHESDTEFEAISEKLLLSAITKSGGNDKKLGIVNQMYNDKSAEFLRKKYIPDIEVDLYKAADWGVDIKNGADADVNFFVTGMNKYDALCIFTHGFYDSEYEQTILVTGELYDEKKYSLLNKEADNFYKQYMVSMREVTVDAGMPTARKVTYFGVTHTLIQTNYAKNNFPNTVVYISACKGMKSEKFSKEGLKNAFLDNGAKGLYGWDENNCMGLVTGVEVMKRLIYGYDLRGVMNMDNLYKDDHGHKGNETAKYLQHDDANLVVRYKVGDESFIMNPPKPITGDYKIDGGSVTLNGSIPFFGGAGVTHRGFRYYKSGNPKELQYDRDFKPDPNNYETTHDKDYSMNFASFDKGIEYFYQAYVNGYAGDKEYEGEWKSFTIGEEPKESSITIEHEKSNFFTFTIYGEGTATIDWGNGTAIRTVNLRNTGNLSASYTGTGPFTVKISGENITSFSCKYQKVRSVLFKDCSSLQTLNLGNQPKYEIEEHNQLTSLDVSGLTSLQVLTCDQNILTSLDVSNNTLLFSLNCLGNQLTALDISKNTKLEDLHCQKNQIASLVMGTMNTELKNFYCDDNKLSVAALVGILNSLPVNSFLAKVGYFSNNPGSNDNCAVNSSVDSARGRGWTIYGVGGYCPD